MMVCFYVCQCTWDKTNRITLSCKKENRMSNMSYCRFENTYHDLLDCSEHIFDDDLSEDEKRYKGI